ncbi:MAG: DUF2617 family protein [Acidimicrobiales bacterium]
MGQGIMLRRPPRVRPPVVTALAIDVESVDTDGRALRLHTGPTPHHAVRTLAVDLGPWRVDLDILSASHRVTVRAGDGATELLVRETVACGASDDAVDADTLPGTYGWSVNEWEVQFTSKTVVGDDAVRMAASQLEHLHDVPTAIVGRFPGDDLALTALVADLQMLPISGAAQLAWHSWHLYPGVDPHAVITHTVARPPAGARSSMSVDRQRKDLVR